MHDINSRSRKSCKLPWLGCYNVKTTPFIQPKEQQRKYYVNEIKTHAKSIHIKVGINCTLLK